jgi:aerotolerance regulator-like protein/VWA domain-containing protein
VIFLNPLVLFGLIAAAFPVLFHLFAQRKARRIEFSSLRFLRQLEKSSMRKVKLRQILLLLLRTLLIIFLVMAFARPTIQGYLGGFFGSSSANTTLVFLIDNSASMEQRSGGTTAFRNAQDAAGKLLSILNEGDEVILIPLADITPGKQYEPLHSAPDIRKAILDMHTKDAPARMADGLRVASSTLSNSLNINKELYLFTDAQRSNFAVKDSVVEQLTLFDKRTKMYLVEVGTEAKSLRNLSMDSIKSLTTIFEPGRPLEFEFFIRNGGDQKIENAGLSLFYNDERVAQRTIVSVEPHSTERITLSGSPKGTGTLGVRAEVEEDALPFDNKRYFSTEIPNARRIGVFFAIPSDAEYVKLALAQTTVTGDILPFVLEEHRIEELRMLPSLRSRLDAVFVEAGSTLYEEDVKGLSEYVNGGGGVAFFPSSSLDAESYNTNVAPRLGMPRIERREESAASYFSFTQFDLAHPFFTGMFGDGGSTRGVESPKVAAYYKFSAGGTPLISLSKGSPFLVEISKGKGKILLTSITPTFAMSDFPRKGVFLPIIRRTAAYLASLATRADRGGDQFFTDAPFEVTLPDLPGEAPGSSLVVRYPDGSTERSQSVLSADGRLRLQMNGARQAGIYTVFKDIEGRVPVTSFAVNVRTQEADLVRMPATEIEAYIAPQFAAKEKALATLDISQDFARKVKESRYGVELWQTFLFIALACAVAEMLIAREGKRNVAANAPKVKAADPV